MKFGNLATLKAKKNSNTTLVLIALEAAVRFITLGLKRRWLMHFTVKCFYELALRLSSHQLNADLRYLKY